MIRQITICVFIAAAWLSCKGPVKSIPPSDTAKLIGTYHGHFGTGLVSLVVYYINGDQAGGYDLRRGSRRNLRGTLRGRGRFVDLTMNEPGDTVTDGAFSLSIDTVTLGATGRWTSFQGGQGHDLLLTKATGDDNVPDRFYLDQRAVWINRRQDNAVLILYANGYAEYAHYRHYEDPKEQVIQMRGTYVWQGDSCLLDWQANAYTPDSLMTLIRGAGLESNGTDSVPTLTGQGWVLYGQ